MAETDNAEVFAEVSSSEFSARVQKGCGYFLAELEDAYGEYLDKTQDIKAENKELVKRYGNAWNDLHLELETFRILLKSMSAVTFSTESYLRERQLAVFEASGFVPKKLKTPKKAASVVKQAKEKKEDTKVTTFKLYKQGMSVKEIAKERDLNQQTIVRHLAHYVAKGMISVDELVPAAKSDAIRDVLSSSALSKALPPSRKPALPT